ncbi:cyclic peptide export ABC transporter [Aquimarina muelleri]|uniref:Multidrug ABC transporter permease/ATP-binding protein n=1 Tax=Aquimarina muelleri TaxID=279356 RepID=A0A918N502_9FLAO|nr:cyclic peptide export ABC transporter [Aquimarina muelleri]MCX2764858.1 cyclic peptide export ABC transporter [Aquimarina muelleri]GGX34306.1 multidrug ABC transporter permease/ATP-binding protein [Aquimarina muelleri]
MKKITFLSFFKFKLALPLLALFAIIHSLWSSTLIIIINNKIAGTSLPFLSDYDWIIYIFFIITSFFFTYFFKGYMIKVTLNFGKEMMLKIINKLRISDYESYLRLGEARVRTAMNDIGFLESLPEVFIAFLNAVIMILVTVGYMFWLYPQGALLIVALIIILCFVFLYRNKIIEKNMDKERDLDDSFMRNYNDFLHGFNKIKMSTKRSDSMFFDHITKNRNEAINLSIKSELAALGNNLTGEYSFYFLIGIILFVMPVVFGVDQGVIAGFMVAILFLIGPIGNIINLMKTLIGYKIAFSRLNEFNEITTGNFDYQDLQATPNQLGDFKKLSINNLSYQYVDEKESVIFELQPINLEIQKGEVIFIYGGNGSGKSTFINLLSGLYIPKSGEMLFNDVLITNNNRSDYRDMLSCIFSDNYLFTENYDNFDLLPSNEQLNELLKEMALDKIIKQDITENKIFQNLSSGQKKRLALIYSVLEDKDIFIFDEWAAEQDPDFRKYFYKNIIPDLKSKGKTVIAITHDDAYYKSCDRLIKFNYGKMLEENTIASSSF